MSFHELANLVTVRPMGAWPQERTAEPRASSFRVEWSHTVAHLARELRYLDPVRTFLEVDLMPGQVRNDGLPRADARPASQAVILRVELRPGEWMNLPCDTFTDWRDNIRAVALTLERLRDIDRYGVSKHGEQYRGWASLPAHTGADPIHSVDGAAAFLAEHSGLEAEAIRRFPSVREAARKKVSAKLHPDAGGDRALWDRMERAVEVLVANAGGQDV